MNDLRTPLWTSLALKLDIAHVQDAIAGSNTESNPLLVQPYEA